MILEKVNFPEDLKKLSKEEKIQLSSEIRNLIIDTVSKTGGHLASNLGVVELTIAIHSIFDTPKDKVIWDVGHQTYVHKILTGRKDKINTLRKFGGIAGFPKTSESEYDTFNTGHSSTSVSAALGMARARDIKKEIYNVIAVIGDGALTGGMALEALNDAGNSGTNMIVILNDNEMSISRNVGGISAFLTRVRTRKLYNKSNRYIKNAVSRIPKIGNGIIRFVRKVKYGIKQLIIPNMFFEDLGFKYLGPVDGNNINDLEEILKKAKDLEGPILIHAITKKGKGYKPAEENPDKFHSTSEFVIETGKPKKEKKEDYSKIFGDKLIELAKKDNKIVAITAAMSDGTGMTRFAKEFPDRFFDVGIAEQHALTMAAGLAISGLKPIISIYASFYQRAFDQIIHDVCIQNLPVVMCVDRAGIVGNDGETHQGLYDLAFFNLIPNITIMASKDYKELEQMLEFAIELNRPVVIRYPRGGEAKNKFKNHPDILLGKCEKIIGNSLENETMYVTIIAIGNMVSRALEISKELESKSIKSKVINARFLKPLDKEAILEEIKKSKLCVTIEDGTIIGGLGSIIKQLIIDSNLQNIRIKTFAYPDKFIEHGSVNELEKKYGIDTKTITKYIEENIE